MNPDVWDTRPSQMAVMFNRILLFITVMILMEGSSSAADPCIQRRSFDLNSWPAWNPQTSFLLTVIFYSSFIGELSGSLLWPAATSFNPHVLVLTVWPRVSFQPSHFFPLLFCYSQLVTKHWINILCEPHMLLKPLVGATTRLLMRYSFIIQPADTVCDVSEGQPSARRTFTPHSAVSDSLCGHWFKHQVVVQPMNQPAD